jgi:hypothetical protein
MTDDQVAYVLEAAQALKSGGWVPSDGEVLLGGTMRERRNKAGAAGMRPAVPWLLSSPWTTQSIMWIADCVRITDAVLAEMDGSLASSTMAGLLYVYSDAGRPCVEAADRLWQRWEDGPAPVPSYQQVQDCAIAQEIDQKEAWKWLAADAMQQWERDNLTSEEERCYTSASLSLIAPHVVMLAALTGDFAPLEHLAN